MLERALTDLLPEAVPPRAALESAWDEAVGAAWGEMAQESPLGDPPRPERWPGYQRVRVRTLRAGEAIVRRRASSGVSPPAAGERVIRVERSLVSRDGEVVGRPDRIEQFNGASRVVDLKTGRRAEDAITDAERRQLLFYAYLWHEESGRWPTEACIETGDGSRLTISVEAAEAQAIVRAAKEARAALNVRIAGGEKPSALATASEEHCRGCAFRVVCGAYWQAARAAEDRYVHDVRGTVEVIDPSGGVMLGGVVGTVEAARLRVRAFAHHVPEIEVGEVLALQDLPRAGASEEFTTTWQSEYWRWGTKDLAGAADAPPEALLTTDSRRRSCQG